MGADPDAPVVVSFTASAQPLYEGGAVTFSAVVTDPQGLANLLAGTLRNGAAGSYGAFTTDGSGSYVLDLDWAAIQAVQAINGDENGESREFVAEFSDLDAHTTTATLTLALACPDAPTLNAPCDGVCKDVELDRHNCGGCGLVCPNAPASPTSPVAYCQDLLCQEVYLTFAERTSCAEACAGRGGECDHDGECPGNVCDLEEQSFARYEVYTVTLDGCDAVPAPEHEGGAFLELGCNCKNLPAE